VISPSSAPTPRCPASLGWFFASLFSMVAIHTVASISTLQTIDLLASPTAFAREVRAFELAWLPYYRAFGYVTVTTFLLWYLRPLVAFFRARGEGDASPQAERAAVGFPLVGAVAGMMPWMGGAIIFPAVTIARFGRWSPELASQEVISPLVNGFLATTTTYLVLDWIFRTRVVPHVFSGGGATDVRGAMTLSVSGRLLLFLIAVAFIPMFTMLGLARTTEVRFAAGIDFRTVVETLASGSLWVFGIYSALGIALTAVLARTLTDPIQDVARALARIRDGDLDVAVAVESADELGRLQDGVNRMAGALRDRARILTAFGRVVEPAIRDRLLTGELHGAGETRFVTVLFIDLRGFTSMAEHAAPSEVVSTLNEFFAMVTAWVRECGGYVDKYIGDAALVVFGLFDEGDGARARGAAAAVRCALGVRERLETLNETRRALGKPTLAVTIAVHSGDVVAGTIGASERHDYTVIGDTVNVAARLQQVAKDLGEGFLASIAARDLATSAGVVIGNGASERVVLRGRREPVEYVSLFSERGAAPVAPQPNVRD
jgi:adenylate cyclase